MSCRLCSLTAAGRPSSPVCWPELQFQGGWAGLAGGQRKHSRRLALGCRPRGDSGPSHPKHAGLGVCKLPGAEAREGPGWGRKGQHCGTQGLRPIPPACPPSRSFCPWCCPWTALPDGGSLARPSGPGGLRDSRPSQRNLGRLHLQALCYAGSVQGSGQWLECRLISKDPQMCPWAPGQHREPRAQVRRPPKSGAASASAPGPPGHRQGVRAACPALGAEDQKGQDGKTKVQSPSGRPLD